MLRCAHRVERIALHSAPCLIHAQAQLGAAHKAGKLRAQSSNWPNRAALGASSGPGAAPTPPADSSAGGQLSRMRPANARCAKTPGGSQAFGRFGSQEATLVQRHRRSESRQSAPQPQPARCDGRAGLGELPCPAVCNGGKVVTRIRVFVNPTDLCDPSARAALARAIHIYFKGNASFNSFGS
jgi:hypothetical protein